MTQQPIPGMPVADQPPRQGCLKVVFVTGIRLFVHLFVLAAIFFVMTGPYLACIRFFEEEEAKIPALTVQLWTMSSRMRTHFHLIFPTLLLIDTVLLLMLQALPRPLRYLARVWFASVLIGAFLLVAVALLAVAYPIDALLPADAQMLAPQQPIEAVPNVGNR